MTRESKILPKEVERRREREIYDLRTKLYRMQEDLMVDRCKREIEEINGKLDDKEMRAKMDTYEIHGYEYRRSCLYADIRRIRNTPPDPDLHLRYDFDVPGRYHIISDEDLEALKGKIQYFDVSNVYCWTELPDEGLGSTDEILYEMFEIIREVKATKTRRNEAA